MFLPVSFLTFILLNKVFEATSHMKISGMIKVYSCWLYIIVIIFNQNLNKLAFIIVGNLKQFFSLDYGVYLANFFFMLFGGIILIFAFSVFPLSRYLYGNMGKYLLSNLYMKRSSIVLSVYLFSLKPCLEAAFHEGLSAHGGPQLLSLISLNIVSLALIFYFQLKHKIFK